MNLNLSSKQFPPGLDSFAKSEKGMVDEVRDPAAAKGMCEYVNGSYLTHLHEQGTPGHLVDVRHRDTGYPHTVARVGDHMVDWTARQLDPNAAVPTVHKASDFYRTWEHLQHRGSAELS